MTTNEEIRKRDALWCLALVSTLDTLQIEKVTEEFNRLRGEAVEQPVSADVSNEIEACPACSCSKFFQIIECADCGWNVYLSASNTPEKE